jgi:hypothetical protein
MLYGIPDHCNTTCTGAMLCIAQNLMASSLFPKSIALPTSADQRSDASRYSKFSGFWINTFIREKFTFIFLTNKIRLDGDVALGIAVPNSAQKTTTLKPYQTCSQHGVFTQR